MLFFLFKTKKRPVAIRDVFSELCQPIAHYEQAERRIEKSGHCPSRYTYILPQTKSLWRYFHKTSKIFFYIPQKTTPNEKASTSRQMPPFPLVYQIILIHKRNLLNQISSNDNPITTNNLRKLTIPLFNSSLLNNILCQRLL